MKCLQSKGALPIQDGEKKMRIHSMKRSRIFVGALAALLAAGCQSPIAILPDGQPSAMDGQNNQLRTQLTLSAVPIGASVYVPVKGCTFTETRQPIGEPAQVIAVKVSIKKVRDRLLIVSNENGDSSTALIGRNGKIYDFNTADPSDHHRVTTESYSSDVDAKLAKLREHNITAAANPHVINEFSVLVPEYFAKSANPGDTVAVVYAEDGSIWANYVYRGMTHFHGADAQVMDLIRLMPNAASYGPIMIGFDVVDVRTRMPLLIVIDAGMKVRLEQVACAP